MTYEQQTVWLAGLLEGEGWFGRHKKNRCVQIRIAMTDEDVIRKAASIMGSIVKSYVPKSKNPSKSYRTAWTAYAGGDRAVSVMKAILPFMGQRRKERIEFLLNLASQRMSRAEIIARSISSRNIKGRFSRPLLVVNSN